ncbi:hypothetical protein PQX77_012289 [Marasmius sp. AFHP31]|nr:hypothetical protein PQX77_012289 [Marasmius sp. AFHP31]
MVRVSSSSQKVASTPPRKSRSNVGKNALKSSPASPRKNKLEMKRRWTTWTEENIWAQQEGFRHPEGTWTVSQGNALKLNNVKPRLKLEDLRTLPYQTTLNKEGRTMYLYDSGQVEDLIRRRAEACGYDVPMPSYAGMKIGDAPVCVSPPVKPKIDHRYVPIESDPKDIIWEGQHVSSGVSVRVEDACILYPVKPSELEDLTAHSPWLDVKTVAMRAAQLRGGVHKCNKLTAQKRRSAVRALEASRSNGPLEHFSPSLMEYFEWAADAEDIYGDWKPRLTIEEDADQRSRTVQQYYPIEAGYDNPEYGCGRYWAENGRDLEAYGYD